MRVVFVFLCVCFASTLGLRLRREVKYTNKYDKIDIDKILGSERLLKNYSNCLLDLGNCTPEGSELKRTVPDALATKCSKCNESQKKNTDKVIRFLIRQKPEIFADLEAKYDPKGIYRAEYEAENKEKAIKLPPKKN